MATPVLVHRTVVCAVHCTAWRIFGKDKKGKDENRSPFPILRVREGQSVLEREKEREREDGRLIISSFPPSIYQPEEAVLEECVCVDLAASFIPS